MSVTRGRPTESCLADFSDFRPAWYIFGLANLDITQKYFSLMIRGRPPPVIYRRTHIPSPMKTKSKFHEPLGWNSIITLINRSPVPVLSTRLYLKLVRNSALPVRMASQEEITNGLLHDRHDTRNTVKSLDPPPSLPLVEEAPEMVNNASLSLHLILLKGFLKGRRNILTPVTWPYWKDSWSVNR